MPSRSEDAEPRGRPLMLRGTLHIDFWPDLPTCPPHRGQRGAKDRSVGTGIPASVFRERCQSMVDVSPSTGRVCAIVGPQRRRRIDSADDSRKRARDAAVETTYQPAALAYRIVGFTSWSIRRGKRFSATAPTMPPTRPAAA